MAFLYLLFSFIGVFIFIAAFVYKPKQAAISLPSGEKVKRILNEEVKFYEELPPDRKKEFEERVMKLLSRIRITGVNTKVEELDQVLIAASAVIPIFGFPHWEYPNLKEVLLYPGGFDHSFRQEGAYRYTQGMVGSGPYSNVMILSQQALRDSFSNRTTKSNVGIHEFVHLVDSTDGSYDGLPEILLQKKYVIPWLQLMHEEMKKIEADKSDINPYALTNEAEFYAVVSEYFFSRPDLLKEKHPELYGYLEKMFSKLPVDR
jgi:Mlc titration factor MtfA (ptsG expression regulator)